MLGLRRHRKKSAGVVGIALGRDGAAAIRLRSGGRDELPRLTAGTRLPAADSETLAETLEDWVDAAGAAGMAANLVLAPGEYQLLQIEAPAVPASEIRQAAAWRIRELIDYPIDQAVVDTFEPPEAAQRGQPNVNVVVAHRAIVAERIGQIRAAGLRLGAIDIPELAQGVVSERLPEARGGHALLALDEGDGLITVYRDGQQFLARTLDSGRVDVATDHGGAAFEPLLLEIQRSFDYFESALSQPPLGALYLYPPDDAVDALARSAESNLGGVMCRSIALADLATVEEEPSVADATMLRAVGVALRDLGESS